MLFAVASPRQIPSFIYPFALGRKEGFADSLKIFITEETVWENLNGYLHREVEGKVAEEWKKWAKMQKKEGVGKCLSIEVNSQGC